MIGYGLLPPGPYNIDNGERWEDEYDYVLKMMGLEDEVDKPL